MPSDFELVHPGSRTFVLSLLHQASLQRAVASNQHLQMTEAQRGWCPRPFSPWLLYTDDTDPRHHHCHSLRPQSALQAAADRQPDLSRRRQRSTHPEENHPGPGIRTWIVSTKRKLCAVDSLTLRSKSQTCCKVLSTSIAVSLHITFIIAGAATFVRISADAASAAWSLASTGSSGSSVTDTDSCRCCGCCFSSRSAASCSDFAALYASSATDAAGYIELMSVVQLSALTSSSGCPNFMSNTTAPLLHRFKLTFQTPASLKSTLSTEPHPCL